MPSWLRSRSANEPVISSGLWDTIEGRFSMIGHAVGLIRFCCRHLSPAQLYEIAAQEKVPVAEVLSLDKVCSPQPRTFLPPRRTRLT